LVRRTQRPTLFPYTTLFRSNASIRAPECKAPRPVKRDSDAPTPKSASAVTTRVAGKARAPGSNTNGASGTSAPMANEKNDEIAADRKSTRLNSSHLGISYAD